MSDRDYIAPLPSWGQFLVFLLVFFMGIFSIVMFIVSFISYISVDFAGYLFFIVLSSGIFFGIVCYLITFGWSQARMFLVILNAIIATGSLAKIFFDKSDEFLLLKVSISIVSGLAFFILRSSYFKDFLIYRRRHIAVAKKARRGELLDDGEPFYRDKIKES